MEKGSNLFLLDILFHGFLTEIIVSRNTRVLLYLDPNTNSAIYVQYIPKSEE